MADVGDGGLRHLYLFMLILSENQPPPQTHLALDKTVSNAYWEGMVESQRSKVYAVPWLVDLRIARKLSLR